MFERLFDFAIDLPQTLLPGIQWLLSDQVVLGGFSPLEILMWSGLFVIIGLHVAHLLNPLG